MSFINSDTISLACFFVATNKIFLPVDAIFINASHDSVGGQPTAAGMIDLPKIAQSCGYTSSESISEVKRVEQYLGKLRLKPGPHLLEIKVSKGSRKDLGRPTTTPHENKEALMSSF